MIVGGSERHKAAMVYNRGLFEQFIRNGVCGTCVDCPVVDGNRFPELCVNNTRYDHNMSIDSIVESYKRRTSIEQYHR